MLQPAHAMGQIPPPDLVWAQERVFQIMKRFGVAYYNPNQAGKMEGDIEMGLEVDPSGLKNGFRKPISVFFIIASVFFFFSGTGSTPLEENTIETAASEEREPESCAVCLCEYIF